MTARATCATSIALTMQYSPLEGFARALSSSGSLLRTIVPGAGILRDGERGFSEMERCGREIVAAKPCCSGSGTAVAQRGDVTNPGFRLPRIRRLYSG